MKKQELLEFVKGYEPSYNYLDSYNSLYNACIDYMNDTQDFSLEYLFADIVSYDYAEELAKYRLESGGLFGIKQFVADADLMCDLFVLDGCGDLRDLTIKDLEVLKEQIIYELEK